MKIQSTSHSQNHANQVHQFETTSNSNLNLRFHLIKKAFPQRTMFKKSQRLLNRNSSTGATSDKQMKLKKEASSENNQLVSQYVNLNSERNVARSNKKKSELPKHDIQIQNFDSLSQQGSEQVHTQDFLCYAREISGHLLNTEAVYICRNLRHVQIEVSPQGRALLIEWLLQVHGKFTLAQETLFLAVNILDRILSISIVPRTRMQLLGITALFVAAKYEQIRAPNLDYFVGIGENSYSKDQMIGMESKIMLSINFLMGYCSPARFIDQAALFESIDQTVKNLAYTLCQLCLMDCSLGIIRPSILASTSIRLATQIVSCEKIQPGVSRDEEECMASMQEWICSLATSRQLKQGVRVVLQKYQTTLSAFI